MRRGPDGRRMNGRNRTLSEAFARIFPERASFELREDDVEALTKQLEQGGQVSSIQALQHLQRDEETTAWKAKHPCLLQNFPQFFATAHNKRVAVFLDYDGTLTPIVKDPNRAFMSTEMRHTVKCVACLFPTAIISGRGREKVEAFVKLKELFYAGSHGMDIVGPKVSTGEDQIAFQAAERFAPIMDEVFLDLKSRVAEIKGASVEHNKFCVSVHFRNCEADVFDDVMDVVQTVLSAHKDLKATRGRKVMEIRPEVEWNKGHALSHLLQSLSLGDSSDVLPIYIGDDRTDEDAFEVLSRNSKGIGILVSTKVKETMATYRVRDPAEVRVFLETLVQWGTGKENAWHSEGACKGWKLDLKRLEEPAEADPSHDQHAESLKGVDSSAESPHIPAASRPPIHPKTSITLDRRLSSQDVPTFIPPRMSNEAAAKYNDQDVLTSVNIEGYHDLPASPFLSTNGQHSQLPSKR